MRVEPVRIGLMALLMLQLAACASTRDDESEPRDPDNPVVDCGTLAFHTALRDDQATLYLPGLALSLPRRETEEGRRYAGNGYELERQGEKISARTPDQNPGDCRISRDHNPWAHAWLRGVRFRAFGHEPDWILEIGRGRQLKLEWDDGDEKLTTTMPRASLRDDLVTYRHETEEHKLRLEILEHPCQEDGRDEQHSHAVRVTIDGRTLHGCGRGLAPAEAAP